MEWLKSRLSFLFTDIEGSIHLWDSDTRDEPRPGETRCTRDKRHQSQWRKDLCSDRRRLRGGFRRPRYGHHAALSIQNEMAAEAMQPRLRVRAGIHTGPAEERAGNFYGPTLNHCARLTEAAAGGQTLISCDSMAMLLRPIEALCLGERVLRDLPRPMIIYQAIHPCRSTFSKTLTEATA